MFLYAGYEPGIRLKPSYLPYPSAFLMIPRGRIIMSALGISIALRGTQRLTDRDSAGGAPACVRVSRGPSCSAKLTHVLLPLSLLSAFSFLFYFAFILRTYCVQGTVLHRDVLRNRSSLENNKGDGQINQQFQNVIKWRTKITSQTSKNQWMCLV